MHPFSSTENTEACEILYLAIYIGYRITEVILIAALKRSDNFKEVYSVWNCVIEGSVDVSWIIRDLHLAQFEVGKIYHGVNVLCIRYTSQISKCHEPATWIHTWLNSRNRLRALQGVLRLLYLYSKPPMIGNSVV